MEGFNHLGKWKTVLSIHRNPQGTVDPMEGERRDAEVGRWRKVHRTCVGPITIIDTSFAVEQSTIKDE